MRRLSISLSTFFFFLLLPVAVQAASLNLSPASGTKSVGTPFTVTVSVTSADRSVNAVSGSLTYPADALEVVSVSKAGSVLGLWVQEPTFSNAQGRVTFEGVVLNPGFIGTGGTVLSITFKPKREGDVRLAFVTGSILANDGKGTNIASALGKAEYTIGGSKPSEVTPTPTPTPTPVSQPAPVGGKQPPPPSIQSSTHPDSTRWYAENRVAFQWNTTADTQAVRLLFDQSPTTQPSITYSSALHAKEVQDVADGVWFFHVQLKNASGWGGTAHFPVRIDSVPPGNVNVTEVGDDGASATFLIEAEDAVSGIDHFEIQTDDGQPQEWQVTDIASITFATADLSSGNHVLHVTAYDKAGNGLTQSVDFSVSGVRSVPKFTSYPKQLIAGTALTVEGSVEPNAKLTVWMQRGTGEPEDFHVVADETGTFRFQTRGTMELGTYALWAQVMNDAGVDGPPSDHITIKVTQSFWDGPFSWVAFIGLGFLFGALFALGFWFVFLRYMRRFIRVPREEVAAIAKEVTKITAEKRRTKTAIKRPRARSTRTKT